MNGTETGRDEAAGESGAARDGRVERGNQTRRLVMRRAADIASVEGLDGLTIGRLATELSLSKSGVFALFGSKEELQLATVRAARRIFLDHVAFPALDVPGGRERLLALCRNWLAYSRERVFPGGCFFFAVAAEFDSRPGPVRDAIVAARLEWVAYIEDGVRAATEAGELPAGTDPGQVAFELIALMEGANGESLLSASPLAYERAERAIARVLSA
ncbi:TetR family transcriptional regulator [Actinorhabdospora filicis]|uniref:TetR family transcriptional regulator n=1 Tax=Actinorhabdospora filicis TaxID=1785913 RepID=A0A9W6SIS9_9ACTN|nr:TetR/AcrR family transcriptional regulator [Actinorhabdospora filicis]GLZ75431.1 TetR family transcriptional regulator [Actinorhabdospora filicis]